MIPPQIQPGVSPCAAMPAASLRHWRVWRDRLLASPRFRRWAGSFMLTRPVARRQARQLFDLVAGFVYSQVLLACVKLGLFEVLAEGPQSLPTLAQRLALGEAATQRLLAAAVSLRLLEMRGADTYGLGPLGAPLVGNTALIEMIEHHAALYADLADPVALLRGERSRGALSGYWPYAGTERPAAMAAEQVAGYSALMAASQPLVADQVLDNYPIARHRCLLDVGGGEGVFAAAAAARAPQLRLMVFDLPAVAERARARLAQQGLASRAQAFGGDFLRDPLPLGADVISLVRVVHDHDDANAERLLAAVRAALPAGGTLLLAEPLAGTAGAEPMGDAYFGFYLLAMGSGQPRTVARLTAMLKRAGFDDVKPVATQIPLQSGLLVARAGDVR